MKLLLLRSKMFIFNKSVAVVQWLDAIYQSNKRGSKLAGKVCLIINDFNKGLLKSIMRTSCDYNVSEAVLDLAIERITSWCSDTEERA